MTREGGGPRALRVQVSGHQDLRIFQVRPQLLLQDPPVGMGQIRDLESPGLACAQFDLARRPPILFPVRMCGTNTFGERFESKLARGLLNSAVRGTPMSTWAAFRLDVAGASPTPAVTEEGDGPDRFPAPAPTLTWNLANAPARTVHDTC